MGCRRVVKKSPVSPVSIALITGLVVLMMSYFFLGSLDRYLARRKLATQAAMMLRGFQAGYQAARNDLTNLPSLEQMTCLNETSNELSRQTFSNPYVRWYGVAKTAS